MTKAQLLTSFRWTATVFFAPIVIVWLGVIAWWRLQERLRREEIEAFDG